MLVIIFPKLVELVGDLLVGQVHAFEFEAVFVGVWVRSAWLAQSSVVVVDEEFVDAGEHVVSDPFAEVRDVLVYLHDCLYCNKVFYRFLFRESCFLDITSEDHQDTSFQSSKVQRPGLIVLPIVGVHDVENELAILGIEVTIVGEIVKHKGQPKLRLRSCPLRQMYNIMLSFLPPEVSYDDPIGLHFSLVHSIKSEQTKLDTDIFVERVPNVTALTQGIAVEINNISGTLHKDIVKVAAAEHLEWWLEGILHGVFIEDFVVRKHSIVGGVVDGNLVFPLDSLGLEGKILILEIFLTKHFLHSPSLLFLLAVLTNQLLMMLFTLLALLLLLQLGYFIQFLFLQLLVFLLFLLLQCLLHLAHKLVNHPIFLFILSSKLLHTSSKLFSIPILPILITNFPNLRRELHHLLQPAFTNFLNIFRIDRRIAQIGGHPLRFEDELYVYYYADEQSDQGDCVEEFCGGNWGSFRSWVFFWVLFCQRSGSDWGILVGQCIGARAILAF